MPFEPARRRTSLLALALLIPLGCSPEVATPDAAASYTVDSLANELAFRVKAIKAPAADKAKAAPVAKPAAPTKKAAPADGAVKKAADTPKRAGPETLDDVVADIAAKSDSVRGSSRREVLNAVVARIKADQTIPEADRKAVVDGLTAAAE